MTFDDILPALKRGRLARRKSWDNTECIGCPEYSLQSGTAKDLRVFSDFSRDSHSRGLCYVGIENDLLAIDWELVPEVKTDTPESQYLTPILTELAVRQNAVQLKNLDLAILHDQFGLAALTAHRTGLGQDLQRALDVGLAWLIKLRSMA